MNKNLVALGLVGILGLAGAIAIPIIVSADDTTTSNVSSFVQKLADKLGVDQTTVQVAVDSARSDIKTEMDAQVATEISDAVIAGTLTQRQADILNAVKELELGLGFGSNRPDMSAFQGLTQEERQAQMQQSRVEREQSIVDQLNESGLNTTVEELQSSQEAARDAGIRVNGGRGFGGFGKGHGQMDF